MEKETKLKLNSIITTNVEIKDLTINEATWTLYLRRKNKLYFKSISCKSMIELNPMPKELSSMKYGEKCLANWS